MHRRDFIRVITGYLAGHTVTVQLMATPYNKPIGLQLYTVREELQADFRSTLRKISQIGYREVEFYDFYGRSVPEIRSALEENGLAAISAHYRIPDLRYGWEKRVDMAHALGLKYMVNVSLPEGERTSADDFKRWADLFNVAAQRAKDAGIRFCHHNHTYEFQPLGQALGLDYLLTATDPKLVSFELDCLWISLAGRDPVSYFDRYPGRFPLLHIKDLKPGVASTTQLPVLQARAGVLTEVGRGIIDWQRVFRAARKGGLDHVFVEQDLCERPPMDSVKISYDYLKALQI